MANRNQEDEKVLFEIGRTNLHNPMNKLIIFDARSWAAAHANRFKGGGIESTKYYTTCDIQFCEIDNIHAVRDAIARMYEIGQTTNVLANIQKYLLALENSNWLHLASNILLAVNNIVEKIMVAKCNVLVHCTDGWDRTAQLCALAQLLLEGRFRTIRGFQALIEKDWLSFGHMFARRMGHHNKDHKDD
jgi:protein tyrosine phosphatase